MTSLSGPTQLTSPCAPCNLDQHLQPIQIPQVQPHPGEVPPNPYPPIEVIPLLYMRRGSGAE